MKIAIVCDWLVTVGGAEKFLGHLLQCFPDADLYAVVDFVEPTERGFLLNKPINTTFIQHLPLAKKHYRHYLPLMPFAIGQWDLSAYDLIISSSHAVAKGVRKHPSQIHISYVHTPMRYAWDLREQYFQEMGMNNTLRGTVARFLLNRLQTWDFNNTKQVDHLIGNSHYIAARIEKNYQRKAEVIYPPVDTNLFTPHTPKENFYLTASRFVPYKKIDLIVESFRHLPDKKLIVIGDGPDYEKIAALAGPNVELLGYQPHHQLIHYMQRAKAFIFAADEDFGIVPVEAQAAGTPVIAFGKGGALETVRGLDDAHPTGIFFAEQTVDSICAAIQLFETNQADLTLENCVANAKRFSAERFREEMVNLVNRITTIA
jgi:glycosyltransferase involved in cell wall biosynthesis